MSAPTSLPLSHNARRACGSVRTAPRVALGLLLSALSACAGKSERIEPEGDSDAELGAFDEPGRAPHEGSDARPDSTPPASSGSTDDTQAPPAAPDEPASIGGRSRDAVCARWRADTRELAEGSWSGNVGHCEPGTISSEGRDNALRLVNLYRWLAELPPVTTDAERNRRAQACALLQHANRDERALSHVPDRSFRCYSEDAAEGALTSNLSTGPGVLSVPAYLLEVGAERTMGHRRLILSNQLGPIGLGSTGDGGASCMQGLQGTEDAARAWMAWPPPGVFPLQAYGEGRRSLGETGWSLQSDYIDLDGASVSVSSNGTELEVAVNRLEGTTGSRNALRFVPQGWTVSAGSTYTVRVTGIEPPLEYDVTLADCG